MDCTVQVHSHRSGVIHYKTVDNAAQGKAMGSERPKPFTFSFSSSEVPRAVGISNATCSCSSPSPPFPSPPRLSRKVWDVEEKKRLFVLNGHEATVCSVSADGDKIASGGADKVRSILLPRLRNSCQRVINDRCQLVFSKRSRERSMGGLYFRSVRPFTAEETVQWIQNIAPICYVWARLVVVDKMPDPLCLRILSHFHCLHGMCEKMPRSSSYCIGHRKF